MTKKVNERWFRWDKLFNKGKYKDIVEEFDSMLKNKEKVLIGDMIRRDDALEQMGVTSISPNAIQKRKHNRERSKKRKS